MNYEAIQHRTVECENARDAAMRIRTGKAISCDALVWKSAQGERLAAVADGGLDDPWLEVAVLNLDTNRQVESITFGWIDDDDSAALSLEECELESGQINMGPANLPLDGSGEDKLNSFDCSCCGELFQSTIAKQKPFDQDEGHGFCEPCITKFELKPVHAV